MTTDRVPIGLWLFDMYLPRSGKDVLLLNKATVHGEGRGQDAGSALLRPLPVYLMTSNLETAMYRENHLGSPRGISSKNSAGGRGEGCASGSPGRGRCGVRKHLQVQHQLAEGGQAGERSCAGCWCLGTKNPNQTHDCRKRSTTRQALDGTRHYKRGQYCRYDFVAFCSNCTYRSRWADVFFPTILCREPDYGLAEVSTPISSKTQLTSQSKGQSPSLFSLPECAESGRNTGKFSPEQNKIPYFFKKSRAELWSQCIFQHIEPVLKSYYSHMLCGFPLTKPCSVS